jgi:hypothetical protein
MGRYQAEVCTRTTVWHIEIGLGRISWEVFLANVDGGRRSLRPPAIDIVR